ncbi:PREDICTED: splicing factor U2af large subunit A-like isoform X2 [Brassica oleracea var. oleracea]|uniref:splicing factor U2af large subunit A-like isoform X2 n=1 Tax=Brassica oleracea var. oleracea TaxID=109376 RepID=UPI0006A6BAD8|nr:PREDICTED: splicing factor U2af large subunit A-like isoform X2 [Brassica oleracea var. oleracea]
MSDYEENGASGDGFHSEDGGVRRGEIDDHRDSKSEDPGSKEEESRVKGRDKERDRDRERRRDREGERIKRHDDRDEDRGRDRDRHHRSRHRDRSVERGERRERARGDDDDYRRSRDRDFDRRRDYDKDRGDRRRRRSRSRGRSERRSRSPSKSKRVSGFDMAPPASGMLDAGSAFTGQVPAPSPNLLPGNGMFPLQAGQPFGGVPMMPIQAMTQQATRHARRVYVGGLSPSANEQSVATFFSQAMAAIGGNSAGPGDAVVNVYINYEKKFAFVEMRSVQEASNAMTLDGIIFEGAPVKVRRPSDYNPALAATLGPSQPIPNLNLAAVGLTPGGAGALEGPDRLFVGGLPYYIPESQIRELLESLGVLKGFDLVRDRETGNSKGYAFCAYQDTAVTDIACAALNGITMGDKTLCVRRANQGANQTKPEQESVLLHAQQQVAFQKIMLQQGTAAAAATKVVCLTQVVTEDELRNDEEYEDIVVDMRDEGGKFGALTKVVIPRPSSNGETVQGVGKVFLEYAETESSSRARNGMNGRKFGGNEVVAVFYPEDKFEQADYSL